MHAASHVQSCLTLLPHGLTSRILCPWDFPSKNIGVDCPFFPPGDLSDPGIKPVSPASPGSPALQADSLLLS